MGAEREPAAWRSRLRETIGWDGCLPLVAACSLGALTFVFGRNLAEPIALVVVTPAVALTRAHVGSQQLQKICGSPGVSRQVIFASAIIVLMLFEGLSVALLSGKPPLAYWIAAATMYVVYLGLITIALRSNDPRP